VVGEKYSGLQLNEGVSRLEEPFEVINQVELGIVDISFREGKTNIP